MLLSILKMKEINMVKKIKNPTEKQIKYVIGKLKSVERKARKEDALSMEVAVVKSSTHKCGTIHCVAGWYAAANIKRKYLVDIFKDRDYVGFLNGADLMAKDLGMEDSHDLIDWADENPEIWGNEEGQHMFYEKYAYNHEGFSGVIKHWEEVLERIIKIENKK